MGASEIVSYCVSLISFAVAIWQIVKNSNLKKYIKSDAMEFYSETAILLGSTQNCLKEMQSGNNSNAIKEMGRTEGMAEALFHRSIRNIYHHFNFTRRKVDEWIKEEKIQAYHKGIFLKFAEK